MNNFSRKFLTAALAALAFVAVSCNEPDKKSASPGDLPAGRMDESPRINATTFFAHAHLLERQGAFDRAVEQYRKALELQPDFPTARNRLGITLNKLGRHAEATAEFQEAIRQKPNQSYLHNNLGFSQYLQGNYVQAEQSFIQAVTLQPGFARANMNLGLTLGRQGRFDEAYAAFRHASDDVTAYYNLAVVQSESGAYIDAVRSLDAALRVNPQYQPAVAYLRDISQLAADQEQAEQMRLAQLAASLPAPSSNDIPPRSADRTEYAASPDPTVGSEPAPTESTTASSDSAHSSRESQEELTAQSASAPPADAPQISGDGHQIETSRSEFVEADSNAQPS
ncbi:MAG: tetratricopeptide repeat protein, partial [Phycisphaerales bacterium]|nr:tetratricopeptide repeat protein [Phycisphaerales bacterium]